MDEKQKGTVQTSKIGESIVLTKRAVCRDEVSVQVTLKEGKVSRWLRLEETKQGNGEFLL